MSGILLLWQMIYGTLREDPTREKNQAKTGNLTTIVPPSRMIVC